MWAEENPVVASTPDEGAIEASDNLSAVGVRPVDTEMEPELEDPEEETMPDVPGQESPISGVAPEEAPAPRGGI
jgi:hypothetical protein